MVGFPHLKGIESVHLFRSPRPTDNRSRVILPGRETLELLTSGGGYFTFDGQRREVGAGCMLWHLPGEHTIHQVVPEDPYACVVIDFAIQRLPKRRAPRVSFWDDPDAAVTFAMRMLGTWHRGDFDPELLAIYLYARLRWHADRSTGGPRDIALPIAVRRALSFMAEHYQDGIDLGDIARAADVSTSHLHQLFRQALGRTPHQTLTHRRLQQAREWLAATDWPVKAIAERCGYGDVVNFCRAFKRHEGCTPSQYRARHEPTF